MGNQSVSREELWGEMVLALRLAKKSLYYAWFEVKRLGDIPIAIQQVQAVLDIIDTKDNEPYPAAVEALAEAFHNVYQAEAKRQGDVRHKDDYADLPENIKEYDRALARYALMMFSPAPPPGPTMTAKSPSSNGRIPDFQSGGAGSIPAGDAMTDDEALDIILDAMAKAYFTNKRTSGVDKAESEYDRHYSAFSCLRRRLQDAVMYERKWSDLIETTSTRTDQNKPKRVSREWVEAFVKGWTGVPMPTRTLMELCADMLKELGYEVEEGKS